MVIFVLKKNQTQVLNLYFLTPPPSSTEIKFGKQLFVEESRFRGAFGDAAINHDTAVARTVSVQKRHHILHGDEGDAIYELLTIVLFPGARFAERQEISLYRRVVPWRRPIREDDVSRGRGVVAYRTKDRLRFRVLWKLGVPEKTP